MRYRLEIAKGTFNRGLNRAINPFRIIVLLSAFVASSCNARAQIKIRPTDESYGRAFALLPKEDQEILGNGVAFEFEAKTAIFHGVFSTPTKQSLNDLFSVDYRIFAEYLNEHLNHAQAVVIRNSEIWVYESEIMDIGTMAYGFKVELHIRRTDSATIVAEGYGKGPKFSAWRVWNANTNPLSISSANIGFMRALLTAYADLERKWDALPNHSPEPTHGAVH